MRGKDVVNASFVTMFGACAGLFFFKASTFRGYFAGGCVSTSLSTAYHVERGDFKAVTADVITCAITGLLGAAITYATKLPPFRALLLAGVIIQFIGWCFEAMSNFPRLQHAEHAVHP
jgi:hypothetical protein